MEFIFTEPDVNHCLSIIAQKLSRDSLVNSFMLKLCVNKEGSVHICYISFDHLSYRDKQPVSIINLISKKFLLLKSVPQNLLDSVLLEIKFLLSRLSLPR